MDNRSLRKLVVDYLGGVCQYCGSESNLEIHHITPLYAGGTNSMGNIEVVCEDCHGRLTSQAYRVYPASGQSKPVCRCTGEKKEALVRLEELVTLSTSHKEELLSMLGNLRGL